MDLPKIALGAWAWGNDGTFGVNYTEKDLKKVFDEGMKNGFNLWDTAYAYGMGQSEKVLGDFIKNYDRDKIIISDKFTPQCEDGTPEAMQNMLNNSMKLLYTDYIDIYWIHNPMDVEKYTPMIAPLYKKGLIKSVGVSNHNLQELKRAQEILDKDGIKISAVQNHYSLLNRSSETSGILDYCKENDITFYSYMVLEQGALTGNFDKNHPFPEGSDRANSYNDKLDKLEELNKALNEVAQKHNTKIPVIATAWAINKETLPIIGVTKVNHVLDAKEASDIVLTEDEIKYLEDTADKLGVSTIRYWEKEMK